MPFDPSDLPADTQLLIALRKHLTPEQWSPYPSDKQGCILQWLQREEPDQMTFFQALRRLTRVLPWDVPSIPAFNDSSAHTLNDVVLLVDKAIASGA